MPKRKIHRKPAVSPDVLAGRKLEALIRWTDHLDPAPKPNVDPEDRPDKVYAAALNLLGLLFVRRLINAAKVGDSNAIRELVRYCCEMTEAIEEISETRGDSLIALAGGRANWPVMISRHETAAKPVAAYLDRIKLGAKCIINAGGAHVAKYSLRTPINRLVWRKLKGLRFSIELMSDVPEIAAIDLASLPKLTKSTAKLWADRALMPYISAMYQDYSEVPEFSGILARPGVKTRGQQRREIRKDVIRALESLAPVA